MLLRKYSNIDYILNLNFNEGYEFILKAFEKDLERTIWEKWLIDYQSMDKKNFKSFEEYKKAIMMPIAEKQLTKEELLEQAKEIEKEISKKRGE